MGFSYGGVSFSRWSDRELHRQRSEAAAKGAATRLENDAKAHLDASLDALSRKLVMVMVDQVNAAIVRPGPKPEERECYEMAQELHEHKPELEALVKAVLAQHGIKPEGTF